MPGDIKMIEFLNDVLNAELTAVNQQHAGKLVARILLLKGTPNLTRSGPVRAGTDVKALLKSELALKLDGIPRLKAATKYAVESGDDVSRELFHAILVDDEERVDYLEGQLHVISEIGLETYLAQQPLED